IVAEQRDQPARGPQREKQQTQKRGLAGARGPGEELERTLIDTERKIAQNLGTEAIAQAHVFEPDHLPLRTRPAGRRVAPCLDSGLIAARGLFGPPLCCAWARELAMRRRASSPAFSSSRGGPRATRRPMICEFVNGRPLPSSRGLVPATGADRRSGTVLAEERGRGAHSDRRERGRNPQLDCARA